MAEYKRKKVKKISAKPPGRAKKAAVPRVKRSATQEKIAMRPSVKAAKHSRPAPERKVKNTAPKNKPTATKKSSGYKFKVINGFKKKYTIKSAVIGISALVITIAVLILNIAVPVNLIEAVGNITASIGYSNDYPIALSGASVIDVRLSNNIFYVLSDTHIDMFNSSGKLIRSLQHGYSSPALRVTAGRSIVYDIGGTDYMVFNLYKTYFSGETEEEIISADISRSGTFALATKSTRYNSEAQVLDRYGESKYIWYCSEGVISDLALSGNGNKLAVSVQSADSGKILTKVNVLKYDSATPVSTISYSDSFYAITPVSYSKFSALASNAFDLCHYSNKEPQRNTFEHPVSMLREDYADYSILVSHLSANKSANTITILNKNGKIVCSVEYSGTVRDVVYKSGSIFVLGDSRISKINTKGETIASEVCSFSAIRLAPIGASEVFIISDTTLERVKF